ncbi:hypothetical protein TD95_000957 [Thielaviopsis punctulata]|uniref:Ribonuclease H2 subunit B n=1 Tax=Thielaviopsis punctulata TaxID=72032 RepID=A0A0F4ZGH8_9PEZI|nr:hypothetical protein TD95_000957 [Thielaviopsis punctulata]
MPRATRSTKPAPASAGLDAQTSASTSGKKYSLPAAANPRRIFVLPRAASPSARIVTLPNPRSQKPTRYLACPSSGLYEFTQVSSETPRSWLVQTSWPSAEVPDAADELSKTSDELSTLGDGDLFVATAMDPVFILISALYTNTSKDEKRRYLSADDHFDEIPKDASHLWNILRWPTMRAIFESRLAAICATADLGDETMYCLDDLKLLELILAKANCFAADGLPASMEEKFVTKILEAPLAFHAAAPGTVLYDGENTAPSAAAAPSPCIPSDMLALQRQRIAFNYICAMYIPAGVETALRALLAQKVDFAPLDAYTAALSRSRADAAATRALDMTRKHPLEDADDIAAEKKRRVDEEAKKKKMVTRGVRDLQKVNTSGMKKLSHFFKKV